ncbi:hypothetical protein J2750_002224 [Methanococcoides alaskense]|uniref:Uncharacterized protein n=1 Tax=Methanococcoides alaskense TaxID=325778 RepID=A0AA90ZDR2_9EURY|nr:hypothetical protein [Methanococcoides alaskense]
MGWSGMVGNIRHDKSNISEVERDLMEQALIDLELYLLNL